jgi:hypothetical protein
LLPRCESITKYAVLIPVDEATQVGGDAAGIGSQDVVIMVAESPDEMGRTSSVTAVLKEGVSVGVLVVEVVVAFTGMYGCSLSVKQVAQQDKVCRFVFFNF